MLVLYTLLAVGIILLLGALVLRAVRQQELRTWTLSETQLNELSAFRRIIGHGDLAKLALAVERDVAAKRNANSPTTTAHRPIATAAPEVAASPV